MHPPPPSYNDSFINFNIIENNINNNSNSKNVNNYNT